MGKRLLERIEVLHFYLLFKRGAALRPRTPVDGSGHLASDMFQVLEVFEKIPWSHKWRG
jgi:hypothetical protein